MTTAIVPGSIQAIATQAGKSLAQSFINVNLVVIVDTSGSMAAQDSRGGKSRYDAACGELAAIQAQRPGKIAVIAFSDDAVFCPSGVPIYLGGGTDMAKALQFAKIADTPGMQFILISDGEPDDENKTMAAAKTFKNRISTIYAGPEANPIGREFLQRLAAATGGQTATADRANLLKDAIQTLYLPG